MLTTLGNPVLDKNNTLKTKKAIIYTVIKYEV